MTLQTSGAISLTQIQAEFGGPTPITLQNYYRGGSYVPNTANNANIPTSGAISIDSFYGASAYSYVAMSLSAPNISADASTVGGAATASGTSTCTVTHGQAPFTYSWAFVSSDTGTPAFSSSNTATATVYLSRSALGNQSFDNTWRCTVTDATSATASVTIQVSFVFANNQ